MEEPRQIAHLRLPDFGVSLELLRHPELRRRPVILAPAGPQAILQGVNDIARSEGLREGLFVSEARRRCRRLQSLPPDLPFYRAQHERLLLSLDRFSPLVEGVSLGNFFIDLTGTRRLLGPSLDAASRMASEMGSVLTLHPRVGLAANKLVSQVAADCIPGESVGCILPGWETAFLAPLPVRLLPGIGDKTTAQLADWNIRSVGELALLPADALATRLGKAAHRLLQMARGVDPAPVVPLKRAPGLTLSRTLSPETVDHDLLESTLFELVEEAGWRLRSSNRSPGQGALEVRYADGLTRRQSHRLPPGVAQADRLLFGAVRPLLEALLARRIALGRLSLEFCDFTVPFRQLTLFGWDVAVDRQAQQALDAIRSRFGREVIGWGRKRAVSKVS